MKILVAVGNAQEREQKLQHMNEYDAVVTSYDLLKRDISYYENIIFRFQVIDEAQYIKNPLTQSAKAVKMIRSSTKFALTGTPIENRLSELWSIFDYLMPGFLYSYQKFKKIYEIPIVKEQDKEALEALRKMTKPFILRRLKSDVLKELPEKMETVVYSKMDEPQQKLYTANAWKLKENLEIHNKIQILSALTRLRQVCCDPRLVYENYRDGSAKLETCMELIVSGVEWKQDSFVFPVYLYVGVDWPADCKRRFKLLLSYRRDAERGTAENDSGVSEGFCAHILISLKAGGTGINLTAASMVIHYDPWWNVAAQNQATDRAYRIGQDKKVSVFKLITKDTIEENILKLQASKQVLAEQVVTEGMVSLGGLSQEELLKLLT